MHRLQLVLLRHDTRSGSHFDLLVEDPSGGSPRTAGLWAARVAAPPEAWRGLGVLNLTPLPPHRRRYLTYQGPVTGGRGDVRRMARGWAVPLLWTAGRITLRYGWDACSKGSGVLDLRRQSPALWRATVSGENPLVSPAPGG